jgi:large subunit ribosomal protein L10
LAISRQRKEELIAEYTRRLKDSEAVILTTYSGLRVFELEELRTKIREANGSFVIVKNTLAQRALQEAGMPVSAELLTGPVGLGFCHHNVSGVAKAITDFAKQHEPLTIRGGLMGPRPLNEAAVKSLANLPPIGVIRAQLLGLINAPASRVVGALAGGVRQLVNVVHAYAEKENTPAEAS